MPNPFDDQEAFYLTLINAYSQYSIWPTYVDVPAGWEIHRGQAPRAEALAWIDMTGVQIGSVRAGTAAESAEIVP